MKPGRALIRLIHATTCGYGSREIIAHRRESDVDEDSNVGNGDPTECEPVALCEFVVEDLERLVAGECCVGLVEQVLGPWAVPRPL